MKYKNYEITDFPNEHGYYEATNLNDCDAYMIHDRTIEGIRTQIDEL